MKIKHLESDNILEIFTVKSGGEERMVCPVCSKDRKKSRIKCFSWNHDKKTGHCSHCNATFVQQEQKDFTYISREKREYKPPVWNNNTELSEKLVKWFEGRKISQFVLRQMKISEGDEWMPQVGAKRNTVQFNYFRNGELVNVKYRDGAKNFKLASGAELIFYNYDNCIGKEQIVIVEGEIDALSLIQAGISNVLSVPNGAGLGHVNLEYLDNCLELFENAKEIIIATDNDSPGTNLKNQLAFRLGVERCYKVDFGKYKDSNDVLINEGEDFLKSLIIDKKEPFPIEGIYSSRDFSKELYLLYENGLQPGVGIGVIEFDKHLTFEPGRLYTWTGIPGCFHKWQLIHTSTGVKNIGDVEIGESVLSYNHYSKKNEFRKVIDKIHNKKNEVKLIKIKLKDGTIIKCTEDHEFYTGTEYVKIKNLLLSLKENNYEKDLEKNT